MQRIETNELIDWGEPMPEWPTLKNVSFFWSLVEYWVSSVCGQATSTLGSQITVQGLHSVIGFSYKSMHPPRILHEQDSVDVDDRRVPTPLHQCCAQRVCVYTRRVAV